jgi:hypothetical protein
LFNKSELRRESNFITSAVERSLSTNDSDGAVQAPRRGCSGQSRSQRRYIYTKARDLGSRNVGGTRTEKGSHPAVSLPVLRFRPSEGASPYSLFSLIEIATRLFLIFPFEVCINGVTLT